MTLKPLCDTMPLIALLPENTWSTPHSARKARERRSETRTGEKRPYPEKSIQQTRSEDEVRQKTQGVIGLDSMGYWAVIKFSAALTDITLPAFAAEQETE